MLATTREAPPHLIPQPPHTPPPSKAARLGPSPPATLVTPLPQQVWKQKLGAMERKKKKERKEGKEEREIKRV